LLEAVYFCSIAEVKTSAPRISALPLSSPHASLTTLPLPCPSEDGHFPLAIHRRPRLGYASRPALFVVETFRYPHAPGAALREPKKPQSGIPPSALKGTCGSTYEGMELIHVSPEPSKPDPGCCCWESSDSRLSCDRACTEAARGSHADLLPMRARSRGGGIRASRLGSCRVHSTLCIAHCPPRSLCSLGPQLLLPIRSHPSFSSRKKVLTELVRRFTGFYESFCCRRTRLVVSAEI